MRAAAISVLCLFAACSEPQIAESSRTACLNGTDDDADGNVDCDDPDCSNTAACELSLERCRNNIDEDGDDQFDCEDSDCVDAGFCEPFATACSVAPQSGCPLGMGCVLADVNTYACFAMGAGATGELCEVFEDCAPGYECLDVDGAFGVCEQYCASDRHCPRGSLCTHSDIEPGTCGIPCGPGMLAPLFEACPGDMRCESWHRISGLPYAAGGSVWACTTAVFFDGTAMLGDPCYDWPFSDELDFVCAEGLACQADAAGDHRCRELCVPEDIGIAECSFGEQCLPFYPADPRPGALYPQLGACIPQ